MLWGIGGIAFGREELKCLGKNQCHCHFVQLVTHVNCTGKCRVAVSTHTLSFVGKAVLLQAWSGPEGSLKLRFPDFMTMAQEGGEVVSLTHRPHLPPGNPSGTHFC